MNYFEKYQEYAANDTNPMLVSGRFIFQEESFRKIVPDICEKLQIKPADELLDIGCNIGELTIPLSFLCKSVTGIDGDTCITHLKKRISGIHNISLYAGDFFEADVTGKFDCVLIYSVIHYLDNYDRALKFILKAASLLKSGGRMLVGDIPNRSKQKRFLKSELGQKVDKEYEEKILNEPVEKIRAEKALGTEGRYEIYDEDVLRFMKDLRAEGYDAYLLPQHDGLPSGFTREDLLITKL